MASCIASLGSLDHLHPNRRCRSVKEVRAPLRTYSIDADMYRLTTKKGIYDHDMGIYMERGYKVRKAH